MNTEPYGEDVRPWPGLGYFMNYEALLASIVHVEDRIYASVVPQESGAWHWAVGAFGYHPDGDLWNPYFKGVNATEYFANKDAIACAKEFCGASTERKKSTMSMIGYVILDDGRHAEVRADIDKLWLADFKIRVQVTLRKVGIDLTPGTVWRVYGADKSHVFTGAFWQDYGSPRFNDGNLWVLDLTMEMDEHLGENARRMGVN